MNHRVACLIACLCFTLPGALSAQSGEAWFSGGASILLSQHLGSTTPDGQPHDVALSSGYRIGLRLAYNSSGHIGHEVQYAFNHTDLRDSTATLVTDPQAGGMAFHQGGYNLLYYLTPTNTGSKVRPFLTAGVQVDDFVLPGTGPLQGSSVKAGFNAGGGVKVRISTLFALRFDIRQYETGKPNWSGVLVHPQGLLHQTEASAGLGIYF